MNRSLLASLAVVANLSYSKVLLATLVAAGVYFFMFYDSGAEIAEKIANTESAIVVERKKKEETVLILKEEEMMKANVGQTQKKFEEIKDRIPIKFEETELLTIVNDLATRNSLRPGVRTRENNIAVENNGKDTDLVEAFGWKTSFTGSFISMAQFAIEISKTEKLIRIGNFKILPAPATAAGTSQGGLLQMDTIIIGYRQKLVDDKKGPAGDKK